jgi:integrase/recombinase XerD
MTEDAQQEEETIEVFIEETDAQGLVLRHETSPALPVQFVRPVDADSLADALVAGQLSERTRRAYASDLRELLDVLDAWGLRLQDVTKDHLHAYRAWLAGEIVPGLMKKEKACAPATVSRKISVCRQFFAEALDRGLMETNPASRLRGFTLSGESKTMGLSKEQAKELLNSIGTQTLLEVRDKAMLSLMIRTGLRRMDVIGATIGALSEREGHRVLTIVSKGRKERTVKIPVDVVRLLDSWREGARLFREEVLTTPLFCGLVKQGRGEASIYNVYKNGQIALSEKAVWKMVERRVKKAGIAARITPHSTRHTFITLALDGGAPLHKVQVAAGHADPRTTERYWRTKENLDDNAVDYVRL